MTRLLCWSNSKPNGSGVVGVFGRAVPGVSSLSSTKVSMLLGLGGLGGVEPTRMLTARTLPVWSKPIWRGVSPGGDAAEDNVRTESGIGDSSPFDVKRKPAMLLLKLFRT